MANPTCSTTTVTSTCYRLGSINEKQQRVLALWAKVLELAAISGTNYTSALTTTLITDAQSLTCGMRQDERNAARIKIAFANAAAAGATVPSSIQDKIAAIKCLLALDDERLDMIDVLLNCKLGVHKSYPQ